MQFLSTFESLLARKRTPTRDFFGSFQVVGVVELGVQTSLFVNGVLVDSSPAVGVFDWAGGGGAGVGDVNGRVGGTCCTGEGDLFGFGNFAGHIALIRVYESAALSDAQVQQAFQVVPEPGSGSLLLLGAGLMSLQAARDRRGRARG